MKKSKKVFLMFLVAVMILSLCACGGSEENPANMESVLPGAESDVETDDAAPSSEPIEAEPEANKDKELAKSMIGEEVSGLIEAIGEPESSSYAGSCLGPGEDGELHYDGFTVYTYKEGDSEIIQNVL